MFAGKIALASEDSALNRSREPASKIGEMTAVDVEFSVRQPLELRSGKIRHGAKTLVGEADDEAVALQTAVGHHYAFAEAAKGIREQVSGKSPWTRALTGLFGFFQGDRRSMIQSPDFSRR